MGPWSLSTAKSGGRWDEKRVTTRFSMRGKTKKRAPHWTISLIGAGVTDAAPKILIGSRGYRISQFFWAGCWLIGPGRFE